jgi:hypothetical protein
MPAFSGSFSGALNMQTSLTVPDGRNHPLSLAEVRGVQQCTDPQWDGVRISYVAVTDLIGGEGSQRGYYGHERENGDRDWGTFEGRVTTRGAEVVVEGTWAAGGGTGVFDGITGGGTFTTIMTASGAVSAKWQGSYELASRKAQAG